MRKIQAAVLAAGMLLAGTIPAHAQQQQQPPQSCQFVLGFKTLHDMDASDIGDCTDDQSTADNGDAQQDTTKGLLVWRKADNWTAFTNGYKTWINGPQGLVSRLNTQRFPWEADYNAPGIIKIVPTPPPPPPLAPLAPNGLNWTVAFVRNLVLPGISVQDASGHLTPLPAKGHWVNIYFRVRNNQPKTATITSDNITVGDKQGRTYTSRFDLRQLETTSGNEVPFSGSVPAGATVTLRITLDVPLDATGGVMHVQGGNDIAAL